MKNDAPRIYLFYCVNNLAAAELVRNYAKGNNVLKVIALPCSGKIDILYLTKSFETGADGIAVLTCMEGECHYIEGNFRAKKRVESVNSLLDEIGVGSGRAVVIMVDTDKVQRATYELENFCENIKTLSIHARAVGTNTG